MSVHISSQVWKLRGIPAMKKFVLLKIADHANDDGETWVSISHIARECEISENTVRAAIDWAVKCKLINVEKRDGKSSIHKLTPSRFEPLQDLNPFKSENEPLQTTKSTPSSDENTLYNKPSSLNHQINHQTRARVNPKPSKNKTLEYTPEFEELWASYKAFHTLKGSKMEAMKEYDKLRNEFSAAFLQAATEEYCWECKKKNVYTRQVDQFLKHRAWEGIDPPFRFIHPTPPDLKDFLSRHWATPPEQRPALPDGFMDAIEAGEQTGNWNRAHEYLSSTEGAAA